MRSLVISIVCLTGVLLMHGGKPHNASAQKPASKTVVPTFEKDIRPLFVAQCMGCHNRTTVANTALSGGLALDSYESVFKGVVLAGKPARSILTTAKPDESELLVRLLTKDTSQRMPKGGDSLPADKVALVRNWIATGASRGVAAKGASGALTPPSLPPGPALDVIIPTNLNSPADWLPPKAAKDSKLSLAIKIGPLPPVAALAFSPDGKLLAVGGYKSVYLWNLSEGRIERTLFEPVRAVHALAWNKEGTRLAEAGGSPGALGELRIYDVAAGYKPISLCTGHTDLVYGISFSPDGKTIASASHDKTVRTWETNTGKPLLTIKSHSDIVYKVCFSTDGKSLFSCGQDKSVRQFDAAKGTLVRSFEGHGQAVTALAASPDGKYIVSSGVESRLRWWNVADGATVRYSDGCSAQVNDIVFSTKGEVLAAASADHSVRAWNGSNGSPTRNFMDSPDWSYSVAVSPDTKIVAGGGADGLVRIWDNSSGALRAVLAAKADVRPKHQATYSGIFTPIGYVLVDPSWTSRMTFQVTDQKVTTGAEQAVAAMAKPELAVKALHGEKLDPPSLAVGSNKPAPAAAITPSKK